MLTSEEGEPVKLPRVRAHRLVFLRKRLLRYALHARDVPDQRQLKEDLILTQHALRVMMTLFCVTSSRLCGSSKHNPSTPSRRLNIILRVLKIGINKRELRFSNLFSKQ